MMYNNKMILAVKSNGQILREFKDVVRIPFGAEYSLLIKNIHNKRAAVSVEIDGQDVLDGRAMIVDSNSEAELTRYVNDLKSGNNFKFVERTAGVEQHRGIKLDDGIIRVTFKYELANRLVTPSPDWNRFYNNERTFYGNANVYTKGMGQLNRSMSVDRGSLGGAVGTSMEYLNTVNCMNSTLDSQPIYAACAAAVSDVGITVPGSISHQKFTEVSGFVTEQEEHVMVLRLSGIIAGQPIVQPVTVKTKPTCVSCGKINKATAKFCTECGTSLQIV